MPYGEPPVQAASGILENGLYLCAMAAPLSITPFGNVLAIQQNLSTGGLLQTNQEAGHCAFPTAAFPGETNIFPFVPCK